MYDLSIPTIAFLMGICLAVIAISLHLAKKSEHGYLFERLSFDFLVENILEVKYKGVYLEGKWAFERFVVDSGQIIVDYSREDAGYENLVIYLIPDRVEYKICYLGGVMLFTQKRVGGKWLLTSMRADYSEMETALANRIIQIVRRRGK